MMGDKHAPPPPPPPPPPPSDPEKADIYAAASNPSECAPARRALALARSLGRSQPSAAQAVRLACAASEHVLLRTLVRRRLAACASPARVAPPLSTAPAS